MTAVPRDDRPRQEPATLASSTGHEPPAAAAAATTTPAPAAPSPGIDTGLACVGLIARWHGIAADADQLAHELAVVGRPSETSDLLLAAKRLGLQAKAVKVDAARLATTPLPAVAVGRRAGAAPDFFILARHDARAEGARVLIQSPSVGHPETLTVAQLQARWSGELILFTTRASMANELARFDFTWFIPAIVKYRKLLAEVFLVSLVLQFFALITPLFFQVVMDKVLVHRGFTTLDVIAFGLTVVVLFEVLLTTLRSFVFAHTTSRIDVELGARLFRHLLALPLAYFQARRVGDSVARVRELENIRAFVTGSAITVVLDLLFSVLFIAVMLHYSGWLTLIVVLSLPCYVILSALLTPLLRARLNERFHRSAENQSFLVETISGIDTVKALALEPHWTRKWDQQLAAYVSASFKTVTVSSFAGSGVSLISKLVTVATMYAGARLVIDNQLTVGQLIAFNMLAGQVAQPVIRLAQLWTDFQQTGIAVQRLGDILNTRTEAAGHKSTVPALAGRITLDAVVFRYRPDGPEVLKDISLDIGAGEVIGIVGRSGSGKSTLTKLIQRLYVPERGRVLIDGIDLALADASSLRRQMGVVLQENTLFARSVRENIALAEPGAPLQAVIEAARLAGAHEFIVELPEGYDTLVGEHGCTLSGGQRQRIAIARALMSDPRVLIFDEATSALDYESERVIQDNMKAICAGRTVVIIAHRLSAVRAAHRIIVMERGQIVETGTHTQLLGFEAGHYARLHRLQQC
ncbi:type I secretion system permease/ATPase [Verminephrobacter eiseniae]|uniref:type I secretion system permease/ATPase n=1 Tax=Verminephrobacter eiseniae TaxID=364317 RepID=UPI002237705E|nr:type I secretion system permease/ATPase [Verminephrobacter eiseniae]MCW5283906.1 type I secretion system permease/ATPase [Verminephrobacter eiseniae]MCW5301615.1 type I secretion system permease/ATPase [Verminephrobacter eiseniae]MCW8180995.1 type I secretion system permease/ATPase [Verminephrobacter eiseniae]MCW8189889.1 type I secretion system permease/ATPase [Verminephrobacter eiseniae]